MSASHYAVAARTVALGLNGAGLVPQELNRDQGDADRTEIVRQPEPA